MDSPLSDAHIQKINEIAKLPPEKQQAELNAFLKTLNAEQIEFLKSQQRDGARAGPCPFCNIAQGKIPSKVIFEDNEVMAVLDINPASSGHAIVFPKEHFETTSQMPDKLSGKIFTLANKIAKKVIDVAKAQGTNIIVSNGGIAGQNVAHAMVHVIPRFKDDGLSFLWQGKRADDNDLEKLQKEMKGITLEEDVIKPQQPIEIDDEDFEDMIP